MTYLIRIPLGTVCSSLLSDRLFPPLLPVGRAPLWSFGEQGWKQDHLGGHCSASGERCSLNPCGGSTEGICGWVRTTVSQGQPRLLMACMSSVRKREEFRVTLRFLA